MSIIICFTIGIPISSTLSLSQTAKGQLLIGGSMNISPQKNFVLDISPNSSYMISDHFALGALIGFNIKNYENHQSQNFSFLPIAKYYFGESQTQPFVLIGYGIGYFKFYRNNDEDYSEFSEFGNIGIGLAHFVNQNIAVEIISGYGNAPIGHYNGIFLNVGFQIFINPKAK